MYMNKSWNEIDANMTIYRESQQNVPNVKQGKKTKYLECIGTGGSLRFSYPIITSKIEQMSKI